MKIYGPVCSALLALMISIGCTLPEEPADWLIVGGEIITMDPENPRAEALAVRGDRIVAVGSEDEVRRYRGPDTRILDLEGGTALPAFIDGHAHFLGVGKMLATLDLKGAADWEAIVRMVEEEANAREKGALIEGRGWHQEKWAAPPADHWKGYPVHAALSAASPDNPVLLKHASGHALMANARAMEMAGIGRSTPDPPGGEIVRDGGGNPTGLFRENAADLFDEMTEPDDQERRRRAALAADAYLSSGVATIHDAGELPGVIDFYSSLVRDGALPVRLWVMIQEATPEELAKALPRYHIRGAGNGHLTVGGIKGYMDGALGSHGAWMLEPYTDRPDTSGNNVTPIDELEALAGLALEHGVQFCVHAIGDRANREVLDLYGRVLAGRPDARDLRWRVEHVQHLQPEEVPRFAAQGIIASMQAIHCVSDGPWVPSRIGEERAREGAYLWRSLLDSGTVISNGTDAPVEGVDPLRGIHAAVTRITSGGTAFNPSQCMTREEALRCYTWNPAYAAFEEGSKGSLETGKLADIVILDRDILTVPEDEILDARVLYTFVGGEPLFSRK